MGPKAIEDLFTGNGGRFITPASEIADRLNKVRSLILDWDGVFNNGTKGMENSSLFSEVDSMGLNMLRFSIYKRTGNLPFCFIVTGESNPLVKRFSRREGLHAVYFRSKDKTRALDHINKTFGLSDSDHAFFFDDILDLNVAARVALRLQVSRKSEPMMKGFIDNHKLADYQTAAPGGSGGLRESCELLIGLSEQYNDLVRSRMDFDANYQEYYSRRQQMNPLLFELKEEKVIPLEDQ